jgi:hypothetical protein
MNMTVDDSIEYQVVSRASAPVRYARVTSKIAVRQAAAPIA